MASNKIIRTSIVLLLVVGLALAIGPATHSEEGWTRIQSERFDYYYKADLEPDLGRIHHALERLEWFWDHVASHWDYPERFRISYYKYPSRQDLEDTTGRAVNGFAVLKRSTVHTISFADAHEVSHVFTTRNLFCLYNSCHLANFWLEGIAMYYSWPLVYFCTASNPIHEHPIGTWYGKSVHCHAQELLQRGELMPILPNIYGNEHFNAVDARNAYPAAGSFTTFLLGPGHTNPEAIESMKLFFRRINWARSQEQVAEVFRETFGRSLEETEEAWHLFLQDWCDTDIEAYCTCDPYTSEGP